MIKLEVYVDMDGVLCDFDAAKAMSDLQYPQSQIGFFEYLTPMPGAIDAMRVLCKNPNINVYILSAPSVKNTHCWSEKAKWVSRVLGEDMLQNLIITRRKDLLLNTTKAQVLVDDYTRGAGQEAWVAAKRLINFSKLSWENVLHLIEDKQKTWNH